MKNLPINIILAMDEENGIGKNGGIPWNIPSDLKYFKKVTTWTIKGKKNVVIMWRKTRESLNKKPLPWRINCILSNSLQSNSYDYTDTYLFNSLHKCLHRIRKEKKCIHQIFIIGGAGLYNSTIEKYKNIQTIYLTRIKGKHDCDTIVHKLTPQKLQNSFQLVWLKRKQENNKKMIYYKYKKNIK